MVIIRIFLTLALLLWATTAQAQVTVTQAVGPDAASYTAGVKTFTGLSALSVGQTVVCGVANFNNRTFSSVLLGGQAMAVSTDATIGATASRSTQYWRRVDGSESGQNVVVTLSGSDGNSSGMYCLVLAGVAASPAIDGDGDAGSGVTSLTTGPVTPTAAHNIIISYGQRGNRTWTYNSGWTDVGTPNFNYYMAYRIQTAATAQQMDITTGDSSSFLDLTIASYDGTSGVGGGCSGMLLRGVCE